MLTILTAAALSLQSGSTLPAPPELLARHELSAGLLHAIDIVGEQGQQILFQVDLEGEPRVFDLAPRSHRAANFVATKQLDDGSFVEVEPPPVSTYGGFSLDGRFRVFAGFYNDHLDATIEDIATGRRYEVMPHQEDEVFNHLIYPFEAAPPIQGTCGTDMLNQPAEFRPPSVQFAGADGGGTTPLREMELVIDTDFEYYTSKGSNDANVISNIETVIARVNDDLYNDVTQTNDPEIIHVITSIVIRSSSNDPYSGSISSHLNQIENEMKSASQPNGIRDHAELFSGKNFGGTLGVAWLNGVCNNNLEYSVVAANQVSSLTSRAALTGHELGHNWGSPHCSSPNCHVMCPGLGGCNGLGGDFGPFALGQINSFKASIFNCLEAPGTVPPFGGGDPGGGGDPQPPVIDTVTPASLSAVEVDGGVLTLIGSNFTGTTDVKINGVSLEVFPPEFTIVDDNTLTVQVGPQTSLGSQDISVTNAQGTTDSTFAIGANITPALELINSDPGFLLTAIPAEILIGSLPNDTIFLQASGSNLPSVLPGIVSLGIGNNFLDLIDLGIYTVNPITGYAEVSISLPNDLPTGTQFFVQAGVLSSLFPTLPVDVTNIQSGTVLF